MLYVESRPGEADHAEANSFSSVRTYWKAVAATALVLALAALTWSLLQPSKYAATASAIAVPRGEEDLTSAQAGDQLAKSKVASYESLAMSKPVAQRVIDDLNMDTTPQAVVSSIAADSPDSTAEIHITAEANTPEAATALADAWVISLAAQAQQLQSQSTIASDAPTITLQPLSSATEPESPTSPRVIMNTLMGLLVGLVLGLAYAFARDRSAHNRSLPDSPRRRDGW